MKPQRTIATLILVLALFVLQGPAWSAAQAQASPPRGAIGPATQIAPAPQAAPAEPQQSAFDFSLDAKLPVDPRITVGSLENGLRYWIRENAEPINRAELRLVVRAGSVLEEEVEQGLAHLLEHMAFNGSVHFEKQALVEFMESIGMRFGPDLNAFTGFDQTVYLLVVPTDDPAILEKSFLILEDWAHGLNFDPAAVEKERGIIVEEWRLGRGAQARMQDEQFPVLLRDSRYAERLPIGKLETIRTIDAAMLRAFYERWYRPDLMAVIAVGDFETERIRALIERHFAGLPAPAPDAPPRPDFPVPDHEETLFSIATDAEEPDSTVAVYHKLPIADESTAGAYRGMLVERLFIAMLNARFTEIGHRPDSPFLGAGGSKGRFIGTKDVFVLSALVKEGGIEEGLRAIYAEGERVARHGFTSTELEREKAAMLRAFERAFTERRTEDSGSLAEEFTRAFLNGEPTPGIQYEYEAHQHFFPAIGLDEINRLTVEWMTGSNRVILANAPEKPGLAVPAEADLARVLARVKAEAIAPYEDTTSDAPLLAELPEPGTVVARRALDALGVMEWTLSNGVRVVLKPTDFKEDEILVRAFSAGGISLASEEDLIPANTADQVVSAGGLGEFSALDLQKKLAGKAAVVRPSIGELEEGLSGTASPKDAETLFQLIHLTFTAPRADPGVFEVLKNQLRSFLENRTQNPEVVFSDTLRRTMQRDHPRFRPMTVEEVSNMDLEESLAFYRDRFADASDFTFVLVGNLDLAAIEPLVCRYLGSLPDLPREETWRDWRVPPPDGIVKRTVEKGLEPKSLTAVVFSGPLEYTLDNQLALGAATQVLETRLRKLVREELSGTYDIRVSRSASKIPREEFRVSIDLGADPGRIDELSEAIFREIAKLQAEGPEAKEVEDVRTAELRDYELDRRQNGWWLMQLVDQYRIGEDPAELLRVPDAVARLTPDVVREAARSYFDTNRYVQVTLYPEKR